MNENVVADFLPINERHAIQEVIFAVQVDPDFGSEEIEELKEAKNQFLLFLPRITDLPTVHFGTRETIDQAPPISNHPVAFTRHKANGEVEWELRLDTPHIIIRCLSYTNWNQIWENVHRFFVEVFGVISGKPRSIISLALQYNNVFTWSGDKKKYDAQKIIDSQSLCVPKGLFNQGPIWHLHQGWFDRNEGEISGRILKRMHINSIESDDKYLVRFENFVRFEFLDKVTGEPLDQILGCFESLHDSSKNTLKAFLSPQMQRRIELYAS